METAVVIGCLVNMMTTRKDLLNQKPYEVYETMIDCMYLKLIYILHMKREFLLENKAIWSFYYVGSTLGSYQSWRATAEKNNAMWERWERFYCRQHRLSFATSKSEMQQ
eukprot:scaffold421353_cov52-Attheya_sp.AAC.2